MIKILLTVAVLGSVGSFASLAMAQGKQGEVFGSEISSQCAHRRVMRPDRVAIAFANCAAMRNLVTGRVMRRCFHFP